MKLDLQEAIDLLIKLLSDGEKTSVTYHFSGSKEDIEAVCELKNSGAVKKYLLKRSINEADCHRKTV
ncbi:MAG: hypothetical protein PHS93_08665 [Candidatus Omnitrophica bacterium]|nr:hypothetical protein [Candidatus Omnitrophota bacterium]